MLSSSYEGVKITLKLQSNYCTPATNLFLLNHSDNQSWNSPIILSVQIGNAFNVNIDR